MQGFTADPDYWKGEVFVYVGRNQNLKDLKVECSNQTVLKPLKFCSRQHVADARLMIFEPRTLQPTLRRRQAVAEAREQQRYFQEVGSTSRK